MSDTEEYIKIIQERLKKLQNNTERNNTENNTDNNIDNNIDNIIEEENFENNNKNNSFEDIRTQENASEEKVYDFDKTQILPKIDDLSEYHNNTREVEKWKEKKYNDSVKEEQNSSVLLEEKIDKELNDNKIIEKDEEFNKENDELLNRMQHRNKDYNNKDNFVHNKKTRNNKNIKPQKKWKKVLKVLFIIAFVLTWVGSVGIFIFFKTGLFQYHKELWVETAMTTMHHKYLATWFLSADEINKIMKDLEVVNDEDSELHAVELPVVTDEPKENVIKIDEISGDNYVGHVMTISDPSKVKFVDSRKRGIGTKLSEICKNNNAIAGINAGGFVDPDGHGDGDQLCEPTFINKELLYGSENERASWIGFTEEGELVLGKYTFKEALDIGMVSGLQFGPYIIVNGKNQVTRSNQGGLHPRMAIGQKKDGTIIFVCIDGRQPGYSIGTTLLKVQNIFERYGAYNAANLDGGSSATMYYDGKVVNRTSTPIGERYLPNAIIVEK